jgi:hypothetical protein
VLRIILIPSGLESTGVGKFEGSPGNRLLGTIDSRDSHTTEVQYGAAAIAGGQLAGGHPVRDTDRLCGRTRATRSPKGAAPKAHPRHLNGVEPTSTRAARPTEPSDPHEHRRRPRRCRSTSWECRRRPAVDCCYSAVPSACWSGVGGSDRAILSEQAHTNAGLATIHRPLVRHLEDRRPTSTPEALSSVLNADRPPLDRLLLGYELLPTDIH